MFWNDNDSDNSFIDVEELRRRLKDEYGTAAYAGSGPAAFADMINVDNMSDEEVIQEAEKIGII
ncbi:hypothetical protein [Galactobacillus timonensis]|uniref:hypothetical protein n=1 Tax=Galactobacillus timonensis TaxID=2041840 RepID=UPI000C85FC8A|nr:hypothetical protein [Galactobacillus timonensis]